MSGPQNRLVGLNLQVLRVSAGFSESDFARLLGIAEQDLLDFESGKRRLPAIVLVHAATELGQLPSVFFEGVDLLLGQAEEPAYPSEVTR